LQTTRKWLELEDHAEKINKIIFCFFLKKDWEIYVRCLQFYFPCEEAQQECSEKEHSESGEIDIGKEVFEDETLESIQQLERDVENPNNVPSADMSDILNEESNKSTDPDERKQRDKEDSNSEETHVGENFSERNTNQVVARDVLEHPSSEKGQVDRIIDDKSEIQNAHFELNIEEPKSSSKTDENVEKLNVKEDVQLEHKEGIDVGEDTFKKEKDAADSNVRSHSQEQLHEVQEALSESNIEDSNGKKDENVDKMNVEEDAQNLEHKKGIDIGEDTCKNEKDSTDSNVRDDSHKQLREENIPEQSSSEKAQDQSLDEKERPASKKDDGSERQSMGYDARNVENEKGERGNEVES